ncbi:MAG TPA: hypothetical protein VHE53_02660 [Patescibacteria group bacterium]|nr:hypothetical protein [Patescibacteria group bacterium]
MFNHELEQPEDQSGSQNKQVVERDANGSIVRIIGGARDVRYTHLNGKLLEMVQAIEMTSLNLGFVSSFFYRTTETGRSMVLELTGSDMSRDSKRLPIGFTFADVWIPVQLVEARPELLEESGGRVGVRPRVRDAYRQSYRLMRGPVFDMDTNSNFLEDGELAIVPDNDVSYFDEKGEEKYINLYDEEDSEHTAFVNEHFPKKIPWI